MKVIAAIMIDLEQSPLGTRSRLSDELRGKTVLRRTVEHALRAKQIAGFHLVTTQAQAGRVRELLSGLEFQLETHAAGAPAYQTLVRAGRMWGLDSWRGGAGAFCVFDEDFHAPVLEALARKTDADAVATIPAAAPLFDPTMLDAMIGHARGVDEPTGITFVQAPPGIGAFVIRRHILEQLATSTVPPGAILAYQPARPAGDMTGRETCFQPGVEVIQARGRLLCDTRRSTERVTRLIEAGADEWEAARVGRWLTQVEASRVEEAPAEIEIELTTQVPHGWHSLLRPMGEEAGRRGPISMEAVQAIAAWVREFDDVRVVLGGFGEPCLHPQFGEICRAFRDAGAAAIAVRTTGLINSETVDAALFETPVDLVEVMLDAATAATYARVCGIDAFDRANAILERRLERRSKENRVRPLWVPSMVKANETFDDLEAFVDKWQRRLGMYLVTGHSHCAGQRPSRAVSSLAPPVRTSCRRVMARAMVLSDGSMTTCDQDYRGVQTIGRITDQAPSTIWRESARLAGIRRDIVGDAPLCAKCDEWHRP